MKQVSISTSVVLETDLKKFNFNSQNYEFMLRSNSERLSRMDKTFYFVFLALFGYGRNDNHFFYAMYSKVFGQYQAIYR